MDKTLQLVIVAAILLMAAAIIGFLVSDKAGGLANWEDNTTQGANCDLLRTEYRNKFCPSGSGEPGASELRNEMSGCSGPTSHSAICN